MKERGMIFNGEMVRAILDGRKTQTRRIMKNQPAGDYPDTPALIRSVDGGFQWYGHYGESSIFNCPFGAVGDRIWVRETWGVVSHELDEDGRIQSWIPDRPATAIHEMPFGNGYYSGHAIYAADGDFTWGDDDGYEDGRSCWKPSIHMPRAACRISLEITGVRVERLRDLSEDDAKSEGITPPSGGVLPGWEFRINFRDLWMSIYGSENWEANPWVWVIEFKRIEGGEA
ncbi:hypothetical protein ACLIAG_000069 [Enterobacter hormaechei]|uniref:Morphogenetic protein n=1 Tax=Enterobacter hormaechei TaxID=158836 RepID=A0A6G4LLL7_9ENTR|nr:MULTISPECIES: hypothetical protein [Enterobacter cloacae complex]AWZ99826.1 hypothetical protein CSB67_2347 [Enterobacter hormaechei]EUM73380.1 hypothetical protein L356_08994 [Enterobacter sp. MGH 10]MDS0015864.1 hypothetical protein [Enterobacter hormaechei subsp. xiangfangensis]MDS0058605.1 hypothetical protein [Enterobacter hormaechei subsp. xiangfangensis]MDS0956255.1 hypothetical protein [Enterobacter hormaechei]